MLGRIARVAWPLRGFVCEWAGHDWRRTRLTWYESTDPTDPVWRHRSHAGPMVCARCGRRTPMSDAIALPIAAGWSGVVLIDSVKMRLEDRE